MLDVELTSREIDVLWLITQGCTDDEITEALDISASTIRSYLRSIRQKLGYDKCTHKDACAMRVKLAVHAIRSGIVPLSHIRSQYSHNIETKE